MTYTDLRDGSSMSYDFIGGMNFVDNLIAKGGMNQEYYHFKLGTIQGATVAAGIFEWRLFNPGGQWEVDKALLATNFTTIAGDWFGSNGRRIGYSHDPRTWMHPAPNGGSDSCAVIYDPAKLGDYNKAKEVFNTNLDYLINSFYLYTGYPIKTTLTDETVGSTPGLGIKKRSF